MRSIFKIILTLLFLSISFSSHAQITSFFDDFENNSIDTLWQGETHTLWVTDYASTYDIGESNGVLSIDYTRTGDTGANANFKFIPPEQIDISENPRFGFKLKSNVNTELTVIASFLPQFGYLQTFTVSVIGDNQWNYYGFKVDPAKMSGNDLRSLDIYFDRGSTTNRLGTIQINDLKISGFIIEVHDLSAELVDGNQVQLKWTSTDSAASGIYKIYRDTDADFEVSNSKLLTATTQNNFLDQGLTPYNHYYYKVVPSDTLGEEYFPSNEVSVETFEPGVKPAISIISATDSDVGLYEKFALELALENVGYQNPYDPEDIDVHGWFKSPSGDTLLINGFYDNYQNANAWRVYFAPFETGTWEYQIIVSDIGGMDSTAVSTFTAVESDHHGPIKVSEENPNYFEYYDDTPFYGLAAYYPWYVEETGLNRLKQYGLNLIGYWNGTYDGTGNGGGRYLIESLDSGLGRYDQRKLARIEQILGWLEDRDMLLMYAVWAHPFLRDGAPGWDPIDWAESNPYQDIITAREFYTDSLAWEYQKKQYRYLIARLGHHRSLGIWEFINEMHGTTGFYYDENGGLAWINKMEAYFKEHDPYKRPSTASFGSVELWSQKDIHADIANRHYYETQGYPRPTGDAVRDGLYNVTEVYKGLKKSGDRPAMLGEAGHSSMFSSVSSSDYTEEFHNAYWSGLASGMASTPFWWDYTSLEIFTDKRMKVYGNLANFVKDLDLVNTRYEDQSIEGNLENIYLMASDTSAFGWMRKHSGNAVGGTTFYLEGYDSGSYKIDWYDTRNGETIQTDFAATIENSSMRLRVPLNVTGQPDVAFRMNRIPDGDTAEQLNLQTSEVCLLSGSGSCALVIQAFITDSDGGFVSSSNIEVSFSVSGSGTLSEDVATTENGIAEVVYSPPSGMNETISITAESEGLKSSTLNEILITENEEGPEFGIPSDFKLDQNYPNPFNPSTLIRYQLPVNSLVSLKVFDLLGREVAMLVNGRKSAGTHEVNFDASELSSGVYIYRLEAGSFIQTQRMTLIK